MTEHDDAEQRRLMRQHLRQSMRERRLGLAESLRTEWTQTICERVVENAQYKQAELLLAYAAVRGEVSPLSVVQHALKHGKSVAYPRMDANSQTIKFVNVTSFDSLSPNTWSIPEPTDGPEVSFPDSTLMLVPALAVDPRGFRLGYGGGYYDRFLASMPNIFTFTPVFEMQRMIEIPNLPHDMPVQAAVTERKIHWSER